MPNKKQKGNVAELQLKTIYENKGYAVERARATLKMIGKGRFISTPNDLYGLFDLCCKCKVHTLWIQVKHTGSGQIGEYKPKIREWANKYCCNADIFILAEKVPRKGFILHEIREREYLKHYMNLKGEFVKDGWE